MLDIGTRPTVALSIRQPWAALVVLGFKDIENRSWPSRFRGRVLIHAGKQVDRDFDWAWLRTTTGIDTPLNHNLTGGIVGEAEIVDCVMVSGSPWFFGEYGFVLRNARPLPFAPCRGMLGFFSPQLPHSASGA